MFSLWHDDVDTPLGPRHPGLRALYLTSTHTLVPLAHLCWRRCLYSTPRLKLVPLTHTMLGYGQNIQSDWNINAAEFKIFYPLTHQGSHAFHKNRRKGKRNLPLVDRFVKPSKFASWFIWIVKGAAFLKDDHPLQVSTHEQIMNDLVEC